MAKTKSFVLHDESINTYGFRMLTDGADLTEFIKNPVMLLNHDDWSLPIGRWEKIRKEDGKILADPVFNLKDERGAKVAQQVEDDFMRAASIGAWPPQELSDLAGKNPLTAGIEYIFIEYKFPVDIRHNSKIFREKLAIMARELITG